MTNTDRVLVTTMLHLLKSLPLQSRRHKTGTVTIGFQRSNSGRLQISTLTARQWGILGASIIVAGALLISLPIILQVLFTLGRLLFLITMIIVISIAASLAIRLLPRFKKMLVDRRKTISLKKDDYHDTN